MIEHVYTRYEPIITNVGKCYYLHVVDDRVLHSKDILDGLISKDNKYLELLETLRKSKNLGSVHPLVKKLDAFRFLNDKKASLGKLLQDYLSHPSNYSIKRRFRLLEKLATELSTTDSDIFKHASIDVLTSGMLDSTVICNEKELQNNELDLLIEYAEKVLGEDSPSVKKAKQARALRLVSQKDPELSERLKAYTSNPAELSITKRFELLNALNVFFKENKYDNLKYATIDILTSGMLDSTVICNEKELQNNELDLLIEYAEKVLGEDSPSVKQAKQARALRLVSQKDPELSERLKAYTSNPAELSITKRFELLNALNVFFKEDKYDNLKYATIDILTSDMLDDPTAIANELDEKQSDLLMEYVEKMYGKDADKSKNLKKNLEQEYSKNKDRKIRNTVISEYVTILDRLLSKLGNQDSVTNDLQSGILDPVVFLKLGLIETPTVGSELLKDTYPKLNELLTIAEAHLAQENNDVKRASAFYLLLRNKDLSNGVLSCLDSSSKDRSESESCVDLLEKLPEFLKDNNPEVMLILKEMLRSGMLDAIIVLNNSTSEQLEILLKYAKLVSDIDPHVLRALETIKSLKNDKPKLLEGLIKYVNDYSSVSTLVWDELWVNIKKCIAVDDYNYLYSYVPHPQLRTKPDPLIGKQALPKVDAEKPVPTVPQEEILPLQPYSYSHSESAKALADGAPLIPCDYSVPHGNDGGGGGAKCVVGSALAVLREKSMSSAVSLVRIDHTICQIEGEANGSHINSVLLRMKLLGTVFAVKHEISDALQYYYDAKQYSDQADQEFAYFQELLNVFRAWKRIFRNEKKEENEDNEEIGIIEKIGKLIRKFVECFYELENYIAILLKNIKYFSILWSVFGFISLTLGFVIWVANGMLGLDGTFFGYSIFGYSISSLLSITGAIILGFGLFLEGFNFQTKESRAVASRHEEISKMLRTSLSRLTQFDVSVQVGNVRRESWAKKGVYTPLPEAFILEIDKVLETRVIVKSLKNSILDRQRSVDDKIAEIRKESAKARRIVLGAGGAIFTGFFAHEVGMSIIEFKHIKESSDPQSFLNWAINNTYNEVSIQIEHKPNSAEEFAEKFHHHELTSVGWVLLITFLAVMAAMVLAARRPPDEEGSGKRE